MQKHSYIVGWLIEHGWFFLWFAFIALVGYAWYEHKEHWEAVITSKGRRKIMPLLKWILLWAIPFITLLGAISAQLGADDADTQFKSLKSAIPPRIISDGTRDTVIEFLLDTNNTSPKIPIEVIVTDTDNETLSFANQFSKMMNEAGYTNTIEHRKPSDFSVMMTNDIRMPAVYALFYSPDNNPPKPTMAGFGSIAVAVPSAYSLSHGDTSHPRLTRYTDNPNDIMFGLCNVLSYSGITMGYSVSHNTLKPWQIGFYIPKQFP